MAHAYAEQLPDRDILLELGRRGVIGGQEDMINDVASELAGRTYETPEVATV